MENRVLRDETETDAFSDFVRVVEPGLRKALISGFGSEAGREAAAEALIYGWQHWERVGKMANPSGYLFRVGQNAARRMRREIRPRMASNVVAFHEPWAEPGFDSAWGSLSERQRTVAGLVHGYGWSFQEVAHLLGISKAAVQMYERRAMRKLRRQLGVDS